MTQISPYGVGAGRMVAATSNDEDERGRQRRVAASRSAEQTRKSAEMREQLVQAERAAALSEARQRHVQQEKAQEQEHAVVERRERHDAMSGKPIDGRASAARTSPTDLPASKAADARGRESRPIAQVPAARDETLLPQPMDERPVTSETPDILMARLIDDLPRWRAQRFAVDAERRFDALRQSIAQAGFAPSPDSREALEALAGSLEFVQGYLEAGTEGEGTRQRLVMIIDGLRQEVAGMLSMVDNPQAGKTLAVAVVAVAGSDALRLNGAPTPRRPGRSDGGETGKVPDKESDDDEAARPAAAGVLLVATAEPARASAPSLERDVEKRKGETPVSIAVKSI